MSIDMYGAVAPTIDVEAVAEQVAACGTVTALHSGRDGSIRTVTGTGRVAGVRVDHSTLVVGVVGRPGVDTVRTVRDVRSAITDCPPELSICVSVEARTDP